MPKSDNKHAVNLYNSIERLIGRAAAEDFLEKLPLSKSADYVKKQKWALGVCAYLGERFSNDEIRKIRMDCSCSPGDKAEKVKKIYESSADFSDFCERFNKEYAPGNTLSTDGNVSVNGSISAGSAALFFTYPTCYCSCVKRGGENLTDAWCICTLGYAEKLFSHALSRAVKAELLESVKTGGDKCVMRISYI